MRGRWQIGLAFAAALTGAPLGAPAPLAAQPAAFVEELGDVPLMPGLRLVEGAGVAFDAPAGRIVEVVATGRVAPARVRDFYARTLPQLGWRPAGGAVFRREAEVLRAAIAAGGSSLRDYVQASGELGYFQHRFAVYGREGEPCPGCDCDRARTGGVRRIVQSGRSTFLCATRQR